LKDAYYFPHFCTARNDRKVKRLRKELGVEGYGIFFMLLEILREQTDFKFPTEDIDLLADEFNTSEQKIRTVITNYQLFDFDEDEMFFSPKLLLYLEPYFRMKEQRSLAGKASAEKRKKVTNDRSTTAKQPSTTVEQSKVNKSKYTGAFQHLWKYYKKHAQPNCPIGEKKTAFKKYSTLVEEFSESTIFEHVKNYLEQCEQTKTKTKHLVTFFNQHDFDEPIEPVKQEKTAREKEQEVMQAEIDAYWGRK